MQGRACSNPTSTEYTHHLWVTSNEESPSVLKCKILLEKHQVKLNGRLVKSMSCGDEKGKSTRANGKS